MVVDAALKGTDQRWDLTVKTLLAPVLAVVAIVGADALMPAPEKATQQENYFSDPRLVRQNLCGPAGSKRGALFRPDIAHLLKSTAYAAEPPADDVPLWAGLDSRDFPISSHSAPARAYFSQGFALLYGFNHWEAVRAFQKAQKLDPDCAICYWGEAFALGPNINAPMDTETGKKAYALAQKAAQLKANANGREAALIEALAVRYREDGTADNDAFADAMAALAGRFPDDQDIATLYAEALMDTSPWDYWERDFTTPKPHIRTAIDVMERVLEANPDHYGSIHLYIHLYEASTMVEKAAPYADRLAGLAPGAGHLVHMPGHIYFRIGRYADSLATNIKAVAVDEGYLARTQGSDLYRFGYYPHNIHFVLVSAAMAGEGDVALDYANRLDALLPFELLEQAEWVAPIKAAPLFVYAQFGSTEDVMALPDPGDSVPYLKAMWHYTRGLVMAQNGMASAAAEKAAIDALLDHPKVTGAGMPTATILKLASTTIAGKIAMKAGDSASAVALFEEAVRLQDSMSYTEPPYWYYAAEQSLGAALYAADRYQEAVRAFEASLVRHPNSALSLEGLMRAQRALGRDRDAEATARLLREASSGGAGDSLLIEM